MPPLFAQSLQVGQLAGLKEPRNQSRIQTIQADDDDFLDGLVLHVDLSPRGA
jgi:hypothetical protein